MNFIKGFLLAFVLIFLWWGWPLLKTIDQWLLGVCLFAIPIAYGLGHINGEYNEHLRLHEMREKKMIEGNDE